tara:strand:- start:358 stop:546 length:189 start_codon:yes stop_codon:yes gene_type:complete
MFISYRLFMTLNKIKGLTKAVINQECLSVACQYVLDFENSSLLIWSLPNYVEILYFNLHTQK